MMYELLDCKGDIGFNIISQSSVARLSDDASSSLFVRDAL